jgi:predicted AlkP superfamily phosphohydrolase/phosphomutase
MKFISKKTKKALVIGIDGVPCSMLNIFINNGVMPNLKSILNEGFILHPIHASIPDVSSVSWTSFATGVNPGEHGIYGFSELKPHDYSLHFPNSRDVKAPSFWEILGKTNRKTSTLCERYPGKMDRSYRSIIFNLPHTYPASPIHGILVSGFVAIDLEKAVFPESAYTYLHSTNYLIDVEAEKARENQPAFLKDLFKCLEIRKKAITHFYQEEPWDLFFACLTETDRLHHFFFDAAYDQTHPYYERFLDFYIEIDQFIKALYEKFFQKYSGKGFFMILSDHGFTPVKEEVYINRFLEEKGFLVFKKEGHFYERLENKTKAFNLDPCRIYIHDQDRYRRGLVKREERLNVLGEIKEALRNLKGENGEEVIDTIYEKEEIYRGPFTGMAPDLVCLPKDGYDLKGTLEKKEIFGRNIFTGMHTWHDAFCILPEGMHLSERPSIEQLAEYIMKYFSQ